MWSRCRSQSAAVPGGDPLGEGAPTAHEAPVEAAPEAVDAEAVWSAAPDEATTLFGAGERGRAADEARRALELAEQAFEP